LYEDVEYSGEVYGGIITGEGLQAVVYVTNGWESKQLLLHTTIAYSYSLATTLGWNFFRLSLQDFKQLAQ
jgi:hypothetical protein